MWLACSVAMAQDAAEAGVAPMSAYLAARLEVIEADVSTVYARDYDRSGRFWFVVDGGGVAVDAVTFGERIGDLERTDRLRARRAARTWGGASLVVAGVAGFFAPFAIDSEAAWPVAIPLAAGSLAGGALLAGSSLRLRHPSAAWTRDEAAERVRAYNAGLRDELLGPSGP